MLSEKMESAETSGQTTSNQVTANAAIYTLKDLNKVEVELKELLDKRELLEQNLVREMLQASSG